MIFPHLDSGMLSSTFIFQQDAAWSATLEQPYGQWTSGDGLSLYVKHKIKLTDQGQLG